MLTFTMFWYTASHLLIWWCWFWLLWCWLPMTLNATLIHRRSIGGEDVNPNDPLVWSVIQLNTIDLRTRYNVGVCSGSLITSQAVLTAAHCLGSPSHTAMRITYGTPMVDDPTAPAAWMSSNHQHATLDLAVICLNTSLNLQTHKVKPASLNRYSPVRMNTPAVLYGIGRILKQAPPRQHRFNWFNQYPFQQSYNQMVTPKMMQAMNTVVVDRMMMKRTYPSTSLLITKAAGVSACFGDSGGPLFDYDTGVQIGVITSVVRGCEIGAENWSIDVYDNIEWINDVASHCSTDGGNDDADQLYKDDYKANNSFNKRQPSDTNNLYNDIFQYLWSSFIDSYENNLSNLRQK